MTARRTGTLLLATALALGALAACTAPDPEPEPTATTASPTVTPTPTLDPEEAAEQKNVEDATAALAAFTEAANAAGQAGFGDASPLAPYLSGDFLPGMLAEFRDFSASGLRRTGPVVIIGTEVAAYEPGISGAAHEVVMLDACLDVAQSDIVDTAGVSVLSPDAPTRYVVTYRMVHEDDGRWTVNKSEPHLDQPC